ncbi:diaminopimelate dehydrogenase [Bordetella trematum]|uniref:Meso-diaminopimelate D-dehydrogenase n=1 Tax=Bordetella trematum TaxID=123899 RepID=A0A157SKF3_9BORD|nr:diaminopimelate dehydrogenase [Bordetella trematum]AZR93298.1 diaminopimelate dehydrogenase [Bordetella trematum]NNH20581.1 diaminopimelate dehydrogenase [Bordetella trematum]SAI20354.1 Meso-diaminopimelate D-dehydrogenase [Bordetella trematum]SAI24217.1 Meso-diaminopimelate D-dehydrogenase [Bordetella trematum]SAI70673.1 Meso-diaminopimelate D-dehydrogenase [Bordetella trematum]
MERKHNGSIRIGIVGYGNLGRGVEAAIARNPDLTVAGIYTRRDPAQLKPLSAAVPVHRMDSLADHADRIDVLILCGGSKDDLPRQSPELAARFNLVDSFDTHARIPEHFAAVDAAAQAGKTTALISAGWDPGMFSLNRVMGEALLPDGATYTFWGKGLSQGHSDAIRRIPGVAGAAQYTIPVPEAVERVRSGVRPELSTREKHRRDCYVVLEAGADADTVRETIVNMPHYFDQYDTTVNFISAEALARDHAAMPHGGFVIRSGNTTDGNKQVIEYSLQLESNPEFTSSVLVAYARAVHRLHQAGQVGCKTVFDVPPGLLSPKSAEQLRAELL